MFSYRQLYVTVFLVFSFAMGSAEEFYCDRIKNQNFDINLSTDATRQHFLKQIKQKTKQTLDLQINQQTSKLNCIKNNDDNCIQLMKEEIINMKGVLHILKNLAALAEYQPTWGNTLYLTSRPSLEKLLDTNSNLSHYVDNTLGSFHSQVSELKIQALTDEETKFLTLLYKRTFYSKLLLEKDLFCKKRSDGSIDKQIRIQAKLLFNQMLHESPLLKNLLAEKKELDFLKLEIDHQDYISALNQNIKKLIQLKETVEELNINFDQGDVFYSGSETASRYNWTTHDYSIALLEYSRSIQDHINSLTNEKEKNQACVDLKKLSSMKSSRETWSIVGGASTGLACLASLSLSYYLLPITGGMCSVSLYEATNGMIGASSEYEKSKLDANSLLKNFEESDRAKWDANVSYWTNGAGIVLTMAAVGSYVKSALLTKTLVVGGQVAAMGKVSYGAVALKKASDPITSVAEYIGRTHGLDQKAMNTNLDTHLTQTELEIRKKSDECSSK